MPCRQANCLRGYRKWGEWGMGMGREKGEGWHLQGTTLHPPAQNLILKLPKSLYPPAAYTHPVRFLFWFVPSAHLPASPKNPFHYLPPPRRFPYPLLQGFHSEQDCKLQPGVWEKKHPWPPPNTFYSLPDSMMSNPSSSPLVGDEGRGEMKSRRGGDAVVGGG